LNEAALGVPDDVRVAHGASETYIGLYEGDADLLMASLSLIQKTATDILVAIADPIEQESRDADSKEPIDLPLAA
jgi:hypothetical protein